MALRPLRAMLLLQGIQGVRLLGREKPPGQPGGDGAIAGFQVHPQRLAGHGRQGRATAMAQTEMPALSGLQLGRVPRISPHLQREFHPRMGSRFAWLADEWYLMAAQPLPPRSTYEDWPQQANGVGSIRAFLEALDEATAQLPEALPAPRRCSWVVGGLVGPALRPVAERLQGIQGLELLLYSLPSPY